jgi:hypothetical protein
VLLMKIEELRERPEQLVADGIPLTRVTSTGQRVGPPTLQGAF